MTTASKLWILTSISLPALSASPGLVLGSDSIHSNSCPDISIYQIYGQWELRGHLAGESWGYTCGPCGESRTDKRMASPQCGSWRAAVTGWTSHNWRCTGGIGTPDCPLATLTPVPPPTTKRTQSQSPVSLTQFLNYYISESFFVLFFVNSLDPSRFNNQHKRINQ